MHGYGGFEEEFSVDTMQPHRIETSDIVVWFKESVYLLFRRPLAVASVLILFLIVNALALKALTSLYGNVNNVVLLLFFLLFYVCAIYFLLIDLVTVAQHADHSHIIGPLERLYNVIYYQKIFFRMAFITFVTGSLILLISLSLASAANVQEGSDKLLLTMVSVEPRPLAFLLEMTANLLYFFLLSIFFLRVFFNVPLLVFHDMDYSQAKRLSHEALLLNLMPLSLALIIWIVLLYFSMLALPALVGFLLPLLGIFLYVGYRHIFLGKRKNEIAKKLVRSTRSLKAQHQASG